MIYHYVITNWGAVNVLRKGTWYFTLHLFFSKNLRLTKVQDIGCPNCDRSMLLPLRPTYAHLSDQAAAGSIVQCFFSRWIWRCECQICFTSQMFDRWSYFDSRRQQELDPDWYHCAFFFCFTYFLLVEFYRLNQVVLSLVELGALTSCSFQSSNVRTICRRFRCRIHVKYV